MRKPQPSTSVKSSKRLTAVVLVIYLLFIPAPVASAMALGDAVRGSRAMAAGMWNGILNWVTLSPLQTPDPRGVKPPPPEQKADKLNRLVRLQINPKGSVQLEERQSMIFTAVPFDIEGSAIHGLQADWESSDRQVVFVRKDGQALAGRLGTATLTARAGSVTASVQVIVIKGDGEPFGKKKPDSTRNNLRASQYPSGSENDGNRRIASRSKRRHHSANKQTLSAAGPFMFLRDPNDDPLPDNETISLFKPINTVGAPPGRTRGGAPTPAPATGGTETNGNKNFTFALAVAGLPGRGINAALSLVYNSAVWNKSTSPFSGATWMTYDVDSSWPAAGWRMTLGQIENQGSSGYTLVDADGTRHALSLTSTSHYDTTDGTFIHYHGG
ncbi:MAG TPA: hypothetical protein VFZ22_23540, partial [Pyrinomonadaceae bacterium]|nr:hypothetical protein [Pyrinomonadaceae bacterium]